MTQSTTRTTSTPNNAQEQREQQETTIIGSAEIVYVIAPSGTGKTFTGDYLALMQGFQHVDGDGPLKNKHLPQYSDAAAKWWKFSTEHLLKNEDGPDELWQPYFAELARQTLRATETSTKVVLTHATYRQKHRDFLLRKLEEGGASKENIAVLTLSIDEDVKMRGLYFRSKHLFESNGGKLGEYMKEVHGWEGEGEMTCSEYVEFFKNNPKLSLFNSVVFQDVPYGKIVDCSSRNMDTLDVIDEALGLGKRSGDDMTYEEITNIVKVVDAKRDEEFSKNVDVLQMVKPKEENSDEEEEVPSDECDVSIDEEPSFVPNTTESQRRSSTIQVSC